MSSVKMDKVLVSMAADEDLEQMVREINAGFTGGRVTKTQLLSWLVQNFKSSYFQDRIEDIRKDHFDHLAHLKSVVKELEQAKKSGQTDVDLRDLLAPVLVRSGGHIRRKKPSTKESDAEPKLIESES